MRKFNSYDYMRVIAAFAVVFLHTAAPSLYTFNSVSKTEWFTGNVYDSLVRWCVPVFFMLSGAFLLDPKKKENFQDFTRKRISKIFIPFLIWSFIYYVYKVWFNKDFISLKLFIIDFLNNNISYHLWYLYVLLGLYLITPILKIFIANSSKQLINYFLLLWFISNPIFKLINHLFNLNIYIDFAIDDYLGFYILGYYLRINHFSKKIVYLTYTLGIILDVV